MGAAQKHAVAETAIRNAKRTSATYHVCAGAVRRGREMRFSPSSTGPLRGLWGGQFCPQPSFQPALAA
jgi:hypothetical protein